ncbi:spheroidene monooxygenase [Polaribacter sp. MED152]|uniref:spheroidene monooxygenase n=1 Tax=Polaribacter sp. MED152 TaxID=313598 RepID=UPI000068C615|nr:spheroidene monooxygenase [Polaribacter sp. MED152]EAQ41564.3 spheroidene monooxygenase [Polaribacter sp. MED152]
MRTSLIIVKYYPIFAIFGFLSMAIFRIPLFFNKNIQFYKLMGTGKNGTFDKIPDLSQWAILVTFEGDLNLKSQFGSFILKWFDLFCKRQTIYFLKPIEGHGLWDKKKVFGNLPATTDYEGVIAVLTRATIRLNKLRYFWKNVAPIASQMATAEGFVNSYGVGEIPWIKQATFSVWESKAMMKNFAYKMPQHKAVIKKTRKQKWYSEDMFTRFTILQKIEK